MSIVLSMLLLTSAAPAPVAEFEGALMRTWDLAEGMSTLRPLLPGQPPNTWTRLTSLSDVALPGRDHDVLALIDGALQVTEPGEYCFQLASDDGSQLWISGTRVVDNDGLHAVESREGCHTLEAGANAFQIKWFQAGGGAALDLRWRPPGRELFESVPADVLRGRWPTLRPTDDGEKQIAAGASRRRPGDGRGLEGIWPGWRITPMVVAWEGGRPVGAMTAAAVLGTDRISVGWDDGSIWTVETRAGTARRFAGDLPVPRAIEAVSEGLMVAHDDGVLLLRDTDGDGVADDERAVETLVPPGPRMVVRDGAIRTRRGTIVARIDPETGIDRVVLDVHDGGYLLLGSPGQIWLARLEEVSGRLRATSMRVSGGLPVKTALSMPDGTIVMAMEDGGLKRMRRIPTDRLAIADVRPMANGVEVHLTRPVARDVLSNPDHWELQWADAAGARTPLRVQTASALLDGRGAFLELDSLDAPGTVQVRLVGPWVPLGGEQPLWSTEAWAALHAPLPARTGKIVPRVADRDNDLSPRERLDGWTLLFDGGDPGRHWRGNGRDDLPDTWRAEDGAFVFTGEGGGDIITRESWDDFDLRLEWMVEPAGNSGIFFNVAPDSGPVWATGPEMQILDNARHHDGRNALTSAGSNYALDAPPFDSSLGPGRWNRTRIRVRGDHVEHWLNGIKTADYHLQSDEWKAKVADSKFSAMPLYGSQPSGHIALQDHGDRVAFRNIRIKRLSVDD